MLLVFAAFLMVHWWLLARKQIHYLILGCFVIVLSFVPLLNANIYHWLYMDTAPDWYSSNISICVGSILIIAGLLDHWQMIRGLKQVHEHIMGVGVPTTKSDDKNYEQSI